MCLVFCIRGSFLGGLLVVVQWLLNVVVLWKLFFWCGVVMNRFDIPTLSREKQFDNSGGC